VFSHSLVCVASDWLFDLPSPNHAIVPLPTIDGIVLPLPIAKAFSSNTIMDVPLWLSVMHDEPDLAPTHVVVNYNAEEWNTYVRERFSPYGNKVVQDVLAQYPLSHFYSAQQCYDAIVADVGAACGMIQLSVELSRNEFYTQTVYSSINTQFRQTPECSDCTFLASSTTFV